MIARSYPPLGGALRHVPTTLLALLTLSACRAAQETPATGGSLVIGALAEPDLLVPPLTVTAQGQQVVDALFERLAEPVVDSTGRIVYRPAVASQWSWSRDSLTIDFTIDPRARWHDGQRVSAGDVAFTWRATVDSALAAPGAGAVSAIDSVVARDAQTVRFFFARRSPQQFDVAVRHLRILPAHALDSIPRAQWRSSDFARRPVGSGRFRFARWDAGSRVEVVADSTHYRGRAQLDRVIWAVSADPSTAVRRLFAGEIDFLENVRPDAAAEFAAQPTVRLMRVPSLVYGFLQFNLDRGATGVFAEQGVRQAASMAIDRALVVRSVFDSLARVALGPVTRTQLAGDTLLPALPFDTLRANALLDSLGWRRATAEGTRQRNGRPLRFTTLVPSTSTPRQRIAVLLQQMLARVGIAMTIEQVEFNTLNARLAKGDFDAAVMAISADPSRDGIRGVWSSAAARSAGGVNFGNYRNAAFDALLDGARDALDPAEGARRYREAYAMILADAPAVWLYEPWGLSGVVRGVEPVGMQPEAWWAGLADWRRTAP
ncbi:MAG: peptide ABC transporter substrate-binding protein [Gemmatimonadaceae bacterium]|jgi:peptide/nickel transport system substrate-binding protein|nr:peptide ABC transporter substrate-binding protein [Gemmatimonadaceae bacterium]